MRFSLALRGYRMSEVDALLARLAHEQEQRGDAPADRAPSDHARPGRHMAPPDD